MRPAGPVLCVWRPGHAGGVQSGEQLGIRQGPDAANWLASKPQCNVLGPMVVSSQHVSWDLPVPSGPGGMDLNRGKIAHHLRSIGLPHRALGSTVQRLGAGCHGRSRSCHGPCVIRLGNSQCRRSRRLCGVSRPPFQRAALASAVRPGAPIGDRGYTQMHWTWWRLSQAAHACNAIAAIHMCCSCSSPAASAAE